MRRLGLHRRDFLARASALSAACLLGHPCLAASEPPPEVKQIRFGDLPAICFTPQYLAEELLHAEGFERVNYVEGALTGPGELGAVDFIMNDAPSTLYGLDRGLAATALEVVKQLPFRRWREANPEDTLRFHALRLREGGLITGNPNRLIAEGSDWRILKELKKELKA